MLVKLKERQEKMQTGEKVIRSKGRYREIVWCVDEGLKIPIGECHSGLSSEYRKTIRPSKYRYFLILDKEESRSQRAGRKVFEMTDCNTVDMTDNLCLTIEDKELIKSILEAKDYDNE